MEDLKLSLEDKHNIYVETCYTSPTALQYNHSGYDAITGWNYVPQNWIDEL